MTLAMTPTSDNAVLNVAVGGNYPAMQKRLAFFLDQVGESAARLFWTDTWPGLRSHAQCPYGFKIDAFAVARIQGHRRALWLDSAVYPAKDLSPVWDWLDHHDVLLLGDGWNIGQWTSDKALAIYGIDRDTAMTLQLCYACVVGINLSSSRGLEFLDRWRELREAGAFPGPWTNDAKEASQDARCRGHRHDQSAASWLAHDMGIPMAHMPTFLSLDPTAGDPVLRTGGF